MHQPSPSPRQAPSRRAVLAAGLGVTTSSLLLAGCTSDGGPTPSGPSLPPDADARARTAAAAVEQDLATRAAAVAAGRSGGAIVAVARAAVTAHTAHVAALLEGQPAAPTASASASSVSSAGAAASGSPAPAAAGSARALAAAETAAVAVHQARLEEVSGTLARLLASVAGSDAAIAASLRAAGASR